MKTNKLLFLLLLFPFLSFSQVSNYPDKADFESGFGNWVQATADNFDWSLAWAEEPGPKGPA